MKISSISIHNFKSIKDLYLIVFDWMVLLGPNNHGKSNILTAVEFLLSSSAKVDIGDFFAFRNQDENDLWVEAVFVDLTEQEQRTFIKYLRSDNSIKIRRFAKISTGESVETGYRGYIEEPIVWWLKSTAFERLNSREKVEGEAGEFPELSILLERGGRITRQQVEEFQRDYIQKHREKISFSEYIDENPLLGAKNVASGVLPDIYIVPAVRDLGDETKIKTTTLFGRLLSRTLQAMTETDERFVDLQNRLGRLIRELNARESSATPSSLARLESDISSELRAWGVNVTIQVEPPEIEKIFELGTQLNLDDGHVTIAEKKGHGLQRAVIFALLRTWAKALRSASEVSSSSPRHSSESIIFIIEEPELFLHPHAQRQLAKDLQDISSKPGNQVFVCSHSTQFVNLDKYKSIAIVSKTNPQLGTVVRQCNDELFEGEEIEDKKKRFHMAFWINPDRGELFFARKVVLVEGETEHAILPFLASKMGCYDPSVSIVDCGSKHNLPLYISILQAFKIFYVVIHDEDPLPDPIPSDWDEDKRREKRRTYDLNSEISSLVDPSLGRVFVLSPDFEGSSCVSKTQGKKMGKAIAALEHFSQSSVEEICDPLKKIVQNVYC